MRTSQTFVNGFSIFYAVVALATLVYLWMNVPVISTLFNNLLDFACNLCFVVIGAILWPGTLLALAVFGW